MNFAPTQAEDKFAMPNQNYTNPLGVSYNNAGEQSLAKVNAHGVNALGVQVEKAQELYDTGKVLEANNEYNRIMSEGTTELMSRKEEKALNVVEDYDKLHTKAIEEVRKKYGQFINYGNAGRAFNIYTERDNNTRRTTMLKYQMAETDAYHETQFKNQIATCNQMILDDGGTDEAIEAGCNRSNSFIEARYSQYGNEMIEYQKRLIKGQMIASALSLAMGKEDYVRMGEISNKYNDYLDPKTRVTVLSALGKRQKQAHDRALANQMFNELGEFATRQQKEDWVRRKMGQEGTLQGFYVMANSLCGQEMDNGRNGCVEFAMKCLSPLTTFGAHNSEERNVGNLFRAASAENSGATVMRYNGQTLNAGDIIVYANPEDDITNPDNLEHVTVSDGNGGYYGNSSSARDYEDDSGNYVRGNGCGVHSDDENIGGYEIAYIIRPNDMHTQEMTEYSVQEMTDRLDASFEKIRGDINQSRSIFLKEGILAQDKLKVAGITDPDQYDAIAWQYGCINGVVDDHVLVPLQKYGAILREREARGGSGSGGGGSTQRDVFMKFTVRQMLEKGGYSPQEIREWILSQDVPYSNSSELLKMTMDFEESKGEFAIDWNTLKNRVKTAVAADMVDDDFDSKFALSRNYASDIYRDYVRDHGEKPTQEEMYSWLLDGFFHPPITTEENTFWWDKVDNRLSNAELNDRGILGTPRFDLSEGKYIVTVSDGNVYSLTPDEYDRVVAGKSVQEVLYEDGGYSDG